MENVLSQAVLLLIAGGPPADVAKAVRAQFGISAAKATALVGEARRRITGAADVNREEQFGLAVARLQALYLQAAQARDWRTAFAIQRELNRLLLWSGDGAGTVRPPAEAPGDGAAESEEETARAHLAALWPEEPDKPLVEMARLAVARIIELEAKANGGRGGG